MRGGRGRAAAGTRAVERERKHLDHPFPASRKGAEAGGRPHLGTQNEFHVKQRATREG